VPFGLENCVHPTYSRNDSKFLKFGGSHCSLLKSNKHEPMAEESALFWLFFIHFRQFFYAILYARSQCSDPRGNVELAFAEG
jgi:hypothetical protein